MIQSAADVRGARGGELMGTEDRDELCNARLSLIRASDATFKLISSDVSSGFAVHRGQQVVNPHQGGGQGEFAYRLARPQS